MSIPFCYRKCHVLGRFFSPSASAAAQAMVDQLTMSDFLNFWLSVKKPDPVRDILYCKKGLTLSEM